MTLNIRGPRSGPIKALAAMIVAIALAAVAAGDSLARPDHGPVHQTSDDGQAPDPVRDGAESQPLEPSRILTEYVDMPDPVRWSVDRRTGLRFRHATQAELSANRWEPGTFLVEAGPTLDRATRGSREVSLLVPTGPSSAKLVDFSHGGSFVGPFMVETKASAPSPSAPVELTTGHPTVHRYQSAVRGKPNPNPRSRGRSGVKIDGALMVLTATDGGSVSAHGAVEGIEVLADGPPSGWSIDDIAGGVAEEDIVRVTVLKVPETVQNSWGQCDGSGICDAYCGYLGGPWAFPEPGENAHPCSEPFNPGNDNPVVSGQCGDDIDNDGDGEIDELDEDCSHPHPPGTDFHIHQFESGRDFGIFGDGRICTHHGDGWQAHMIDVALSIAGAFRLENGPIAEQMRWGVISCWVFPSVEAAEDCDGFGNCGAFSSKPHLYPYSDASGENAAYRQGVIHDLWHARVVGLNRPISVLHVAMKGTLFDGAEGICGRAYVGSGNSLSGRSVGTMGSGNCAAEWKVAAHEVAHTFGADHEVFPEDPPHTFMYEGKNGNNGFVNYFSPTNGNKVNLCLGNINCPRLADLGVEP